jgi:hypothetical protein
LIWALLVLFDSVELNLSDGEVRSKKFNLVEIRAEPVLRVSLAEVDATAPLIKLLDIISYLS